jgi:uncharacterized protein YdeI (YjbR/CyaY-like superfamily)
VEISETLYVKDRKAWRTWLEKNHDKGEIWLIYYKKHTGKPRIPYNDAVEEALCFGWIDSIIKRLDDERFAQRFSPRRLRSQLSEANKERIRKMISVGLMTPIGLKAVDHAFDPEEEFRIPDDIIRELKKDKETWENFQGFPLSYKRVRVGWIDSARSRPEEFEKRLGYFIRMTAKNKTFGQIR